MIFILYPDAIIILLFPPLQADLAREKLVKREEGEKLAKVLIYLMFGITTAYPGYTTALARVSRALPIGGIWVYLPRDLRSASGTVCPYAIYIDRALSTAGRFSVYCCVML